jgi:hypothetical protein
VQELIRPELSSDMGIRFAPFSPGGLKSLSNAFVDALPFAGLRAAQKRLSSAQGSDE